jgi:predicted kinase
VLLIKEKISYMWKFPLYEVGQKIDWDSIEQRFDWFRDMKDVPQDKVWHAEGDVMTHTKMVCEALIQLPEFIALNEQDKHIMFVGALMHDIEKRSTTAEEFVNGRMCVVAPSHARKGEYTARKILYKDIPTPFYIREQICKIVRYHGIPLWGIKDKDSDQKIIKASQFVRTNFLAMISKADILGRICSDQEDQLEKIEYFELSCIELGCWGKQIEFVNGLSRHKYLNDGGWIHFESFDDKKFDVYVMCALPGSGKDTYISKEFTIPTLSLDDIRRKKGVNPTDKKENGRVIQEAKEIAKEYMRIKSSFVFNATNITADMRSKWINLFMEYNARVTIIYIEVPYKTLMSQNHNREYKVPENKLDELIRKLEIPSYSEAHFVEYIVNYM